MKICSKEDCGYSNPDDAKYCSKCGYEFTMYVLCSFDGWQPKEMTRNTDGKWEIFIDVPAGTHKFKFADTPDWLGRDWGGSSGNAGTAKVGGDDTSMNFSHARYKFVFDENTLGYEVIFDKLNVDNIIWGKIGNIVFKLFLSIVLVILIFFIVEVIVYYTGWEISRCIYIAGVPIFNAIWD